MRRPGSASPARLRLLASVLLVCAAGAGCGTGTPAAAPLAASPPQPSTQAATAAPATSASTASSAQAPAFAGAHPVVVLDPGHNGGNAAAPAVINRLVPDGRGQRKPCNTTGTATNTGYSEHAFNWDVAQRVRDVLTAHGITVLLTRNSDTGVGPCVDERAAIGNRAHAAAVVSIHADGAEQAGAHGFHVAYSAPPLNAAQAGPAMSLAAALRDTLRSAGLPPANYIGAQGLDGRPDLGGLNASDVPAALIECGNMRDAGDAAILSGAAGRERYATGIADAVLHWLPH